MVQRAGDAALIVARLFDRQTLIEESPRFTTLALLLCQPTQLVQRHGDEALVAESLFDLQTLVVELPRFLKLVFGLREHAKLMGINSIYVPSSLSRLKISRT